MASEVGRNYEVGFGGGMGENARIRVNGSVLVVVEKIKI